MNEFPKFHPNQPALEQLSATKLNMVSQGQKSNQIQPGVGYRVTQTPGGTTVSQIRKRPKPQKFPPLWGTLTWVDSDPFLYMELGFVFARKNGTGDAVSEIEITGLPTPDDPLAVALDDKISVKVTIGADGIATAAEINKSATWPTSLAPVLIGGDNTSGAEGEHYVRVLEIIDDPVYPGLTVIKQRNTGHIDHFQPTLSDNTISGYSTGLGGRILKLWNAALGRFDLRGVKKGKGQLTHTEEADEVEIRGNLKKGKITYTIDGGSPIDLGVNWNDGLMMVGADEEDPDDPVAATEYNIPMTTTGSHPWKATNLGTAFIAIAAGKIMGIRDSGTPGDYPWNFRYVSYGASTVEVTSATGWIYAIIPTTQRSIFEDGAINTITASQDPDSVTVVFDAADPDTVAVASANEICIPIAEVALAAGIATVVDQVLTHNPMLTIETAISMP